MGEQGVFISVVLGSKQVPLSCCGSIVQLIHNRCSTGVSQKGRSLTPQGSKDPCPKDFIQSPLSTRPKMAQPDETLGSVGASQLISSTSTFLSG